MGKPNTTGSLFGKQPYYIALDNISNLIKTNYNTSKFIKTSSLDKLLKSDLRSIYYNK